MIEKIISFSVNNKLITGIFILVLIGWGVYSTTRISIDALPDVTNNQVLVNTMAPNLATQEVEQFITYPLELEFKNLPDLVELRSTSRSGLSVITIVFEDHVPVNIARQLVAERIKSAEEHIPRNYGTPELAPPTTGLGEIYQYTLAVDSAHQNKFTAMDLRTIQDWIVRRQLLGVQGVVDVSSFGGYLKQYEVAVAPEKLVAMNISLLDVFDALSKNNENTGGSYIDKGPNIYFIRGEGLIQSLADIENIVIKTANEIPIRIRDVAKVQFGYASRYGAMTRNGQGETVGAVVLMLKGANSVQVIKAVKERMAQIGKSLPEGVSIDAFVDRTKLISRTIGTVEENLSIGALIVLFILILFLGNLRAGLIVASVIPLSLLFAVSMMNVFGVSANLMSMGALDFGLIVDGAVIIVESILFLLHSKFKNALLSQSEMDKEIISSSTSIMSSAVFGQFIILIVYVPIFALVGIEGKMFRPMAQTVSFSIIGALLLSLTYVPLMASLFLNKKVSQKENVGDKMIHWLQVRYTPILSRLLGWKKSVLVVSIFLLAGSIFIFNSLGGEFIPELDEGDFATNYTIRQGSNLHQSIATGTQLENILLKNFPEVKEVVSKIGTAEVPTDPMPIESADLIIVMKDKKEWTSAKNKEEMAEKMSEKMSVIPGVNLSFEQPIQMRFNELIAGVKSDIAVKIYGENLDVLFAHANEAAGIIAGIEGAVDIKVEQVVGMPQLVVKYNRERIAQYGLNIQDVNSVLNTALAGGKAGTVYEGEKKFDLVVRLANYRDADEEKVKHIYVPLSNGTQIPIGQLAEVSFKSAPAQISRDNGERRIVIETNVRGRDIQSVATEISEALSQKLHLPSGYFIAYGGTFQNLQEAKQRLGVAVPVALLLIFLLLFLTFRNVTEALIIFSAIPLAAIGGVIALYLRGMNFSISAGIGFIALFGVAVLNGIVLISYLNRLQSEGEENVTVRILKGTAARLRPVLATAAVASLGFLPMAISTSAGSEVQKPLATVVIGGLISSTLLTLIVLPVLYSMFASRQKIKFGSSALVLVLIAISFFKIQTVHAQTTLDSCISLALRNHPSIQGAGYVVQQEQQLKKTNFVLEPVNLNYEGGQINAAVNDYHITATTGIAFPTTIIAQSKFQEQKILLSQQRLNISKAELVKNVSIAFYRLMYVQQKLLLLSRLDSAYANFAKYAETKFRVGESNQLENLTAQARLKEIQLQKEQATSDVLIQQTILQAWTGTTISFDLPTQVIISESPPVLDSSQLGLNPYLQLQKQQVATSLAASKLESNKYAPSLQFGYFTQSLGTVAPFQGYNVGLTIPLFKTGQQGRIHAAALQTRIEEKNLDALRLSLKSEFIAAVEEYRKHNSSLQYYSTQGLDLADKLFNSASKSYRAGDIGYIEYVSAISQAYQIRESYLQTVFNINQSIVNINFLIQK